MKEETQQPSCQIDPDYLNEVKHRLKKGRVSVRDLAYLQLGMTMQKNCSHNSHAHDCSKSSPVHQSFAHLLDQINMRQVNRALSIHNLGALVKIIFSVVGSIIGFLLACVIALLWFSHMFL